MGPRQPWSIIDHAMNGETDYRVFEIFYFDSRESGPSARGEGGLGEGYR